jgi:hypothetical protein
MSIESIHNVMTPFKLYIQHLAFVIYLLTNTRCCMYNFELLMMGGGTA